MKALAKKDVRTATIKMSVMLSEYDTITWPSYEEQECMRCSNKGTPNDLVACINCGVVLCADCTFRLGQGDYCRSCCKCNFCQNEALYYCQLCSDLLCPQHSQDAFEWDDATGYRQVETKCCPKCR